MTLKPKLMIIAVLILLISYLWVLMILVKAFIYGGNYQILMSFNDYNELGIELATFVLCLPLVYTFVKDALDRIEIHKSLGSQKNES